MKVVKYIGTGTGPLLVAGVLTMAYDFSATGTLEMSDEDANTLLIRSGRSFKDITELALTAYAYALAADTTVPVIATAVVTGASLVLTYTEAGGTAGAGAKLNTDSKPTPGDYAVVNAGVADVVKKVTVLGKVVTLMLTTAVAFEAVVTIGYTQVAARALKDMKGNKAANLTAQAVTNSTPDPG